MKNGGGRIPRGLFGALVLVAAAEWAGFARFDAPVSFGAASWRDARRDAERNAFDGAVLCFGDSQIKCGLLPVVLERSRGLKAYNLAVVGGQAPSSYYLLDHALRAGARPRAVVVGYYPALLGCDLRLNAGMWPELLDAPECLDLLVASRDTKLAAPLLSRGALPSLRRRKDVRAAVRAAILGTVDPERDEARAYRRNWQVNAGAHALPTVARYDDGARPEPGGERWKCKPVNALYIRRFLTLARRHDIPVFWLLPANAPALTAARAADGRDAAYDRFVASIQSEFPELTVIDPRPALSDPAAFSDVCHLDRRGALTLSLAVADVLAGRLSGLDRSARVALPTDAVSVARASVAGWRDIEDVGRSAAVAVAAGTTRRY
jgi:hypothetical protein